MLPLTSLATGGRRGRLGVPASRALPEFCLLRECDTPMSALVCLESAALKSHPFPPPTPTPSPNLVVDVVVKNVFYSHYTLLMLFRTHLQVEGCFECNFL